MIFHGVLVLFAWFVVVALANSEKCSTREKGRDQYDIYLSVGKSKTPWPIFRLLLTQCWGGAWWRKYIKSESQLTLWNNNLPGPWDNLAQPVQKITVDALYFSLVVLIFSLLFFGNAYILPNLLPASQTSSNVKNFNKTSLICHSNCQLNLGRLCLHAKKILLNVNMVLKQHKDNTEGYLVYFKNIKRGQFHAWYKIRRYV